MSFTMSTLRAIRATWKLSGVFAKCMFSIERERRKKRKKEEGELMRRNHEKSQYCHRVFVSMFLVKRRNDRG
jgi:hypothetical protein